MGVGATRRAEGPWEDGAGAAGTGRAAGMLWEGGACCEGLVSCSGCLATTNWPFVSPLALIVGALLLWKHENLFTRVIAAHDSYRKT